MGTPAGWQTTFSCDGNPDKPLTQYVFEDERSFKMYKIGVINANIPGQDMAYFATVGGYEEYIYFDQSNLTDLKPEIKLVKMHTFVQPSENNCFQIIFAPESVANIPQYEGITLKRF